MGLLCKTKQSDADPKSVHRRKTWFRGKKDILTKVTKDSVQYW